MKINTRDFGEVEIDENDIITFVQPIYGFEDLTRYVFLIYEEVSPHFVWLQSLEDIEVCFLLADPGVIDVKYEPAIPCGLQSELGEGEVISWLVVAIPAQFKDATVNLKSPIIVNTSRRNAAQVILDNDFPLRYPLLPSSGKESTVC